MKVGEGDGPAMSSLPLWTCSQTLCQAVGGVGVHRPWKMIVHEIKLHNFGYIRIPSLCLIRFILCSWTILFCG